MTALLNEKVAYALGLIKERTDYDTAGICMGGVSPPVRSRFIKRDDMAGVGTGDIAHHVHYCSGKVVLERYDSRPIVSTHAYWYAWHANSEQHGSTYLVTTLNHYLRVRDRLMRPFRKYRCGYPETWALFDAVFNEISDTTPID